MTQYALLGRSLNQQQEKIHKKIEKKLNEKREKVDQINLTYPGM